MFGVVWWLLGCRHEPPAPTVDPPCHDLDSCLVGCGEGRADDCLRLTGLVDAVPDDEIRVPRAVAENGCVAGAVPGCTLAGELWLAQPGEDPAAAWAAAAGWLERGCVGLDPTACASFALLLSEGRGRAADRQHAADLGRWSCDRRVPLGCRVAGRTTDDVSAATRDLGAACDGGDALACRYLGELYDDTLHDEVQGRLAFARACDGGDPDGCSARDEIDDRVHPLEEVVVQVFEVGYAGPAASHAARSAEEAEALAHAALAHLARGVPLAEVATAYGDRPPTGTIVREQHLIRAKTPSALQDAAFGLSPGQAALVPVPAFGYLVVVRP